MSIIKQIWFVRNVRKLINCLCPTIIGVIFLYSLLSIWGLSDFNWQNVPSNSGLIIISVISVIFSSILIWVSNRMKAPEKSTGETPASKKNQTIRDLLIGTNLMITLALSFLQLDRISIAKEVGGYGLLPMYLSLLGGIVFYFIRIKAHLSNKN